MSQFNYFGCTYTDIVNAFKGAVVADFTSQAIIEAEMLLAEAELVNLMSPKALAMLQAVEYMEVPQIASISGAMQYTTVTPVLQDLYVFQVPRDNPAINTYATELPGVCPLTSQCSGTKKVLGATYLFTDYTLVGSTITFGTSFDQDRNTYYVSYTADTSTISLPSVKGIIRDRVACVMGMQLYSKVDDTWALVDLYCTRADKWMEMVNQHWLPSEFKKYKWLNNPVTISGGISTIKLGRS
jgi:hypothetical protein